MAEKNKQKNSTSSEWSIYGVITLIFTAIGLCIAALSVPQINQMIFGNPTETSTVVPEVTPEPMIVTATTIPLTPTATPLPQSAEAYYEDGFNHYNAGNHEEAIIDFTRAIERDADYAIAYNARGNAYRSLEQYDEALADFNRAIEIDSEYARAYNNRSITYYDLGNYDQAIADCTRAIELDEDYVNAYYNCGLAYHFNEDYEQAIIHYSAAAEREPDAPDILWGRGTSYYRAGVEYYELAIADYKRYAEITGALEPFMEERMTEMLAAVGD